MNTPFDLQLYMREFMSAHPELNEKQIFAELHAQVGPGIRCKYQYDGPHSETVKVNAVLLTAAKNICKFTTELQQCANGLIYSFPEWDIISIPPKCFNRAAPKAVIQSLDKYVIMPVEDGTVVTLYWRDNKWKLGTSNSFDISDYKFYADITYGDAFRESMLKSFSLDTLDKEWCYTFGFRHREFHPLDRIGRTTANMWFIRGVNLSDLTVTYEIEGLPSQTPVINKKPAKWTTVKDFFSHLLNKNRSAVQTYLDGNDLWFGFYLVAPANDMGAYNNVLFESSLLKYIRNSLYSVPKELPDGSKLDHTNRLNYMILRAYLNPHLRMYFIRMFPKLRARLNHFDDLTDKITSRIVHFYRNPSAKKAFINKRKSGECTSNLDAAVAYTLEYLSEEDMCMFDKWGAKIVKDLVCDIKHLEVYNKLFICKNK